MKKFVVGAFAAAGLLAGSGFAAQAMPMADSIGGAPLVEQTAGGCGPAAYRDWRGFCRPLAYGAPVYAPPVVYARPVVVRRPVVYARPVYYARPVVVRRVYYRPGWRRW